MTTDPTARIAAHVIAAVRTAKALAEPRITFDLSVAEAEAIAAALADAGRDTSRGDGTPDC